MVFALDGVFVGAGDAVYLRNSTIFSAFFGFLPMIRLCLRLRLGFGGVWIGLTLFVLLRLVALTARLRGDRWLVTGTR